MSRGRRACFGTVSGEKQLLEARIMHPAGALGVSASLASLPVGQAVLADVIVHQVEARPAENPTTGYAPINFAGSTTQVDPVNFPGITFNALANTNNTFSPHASTV